MLGIYAKLKSVKQLLRATAVPAGTAVARINYGDYVCPSVYWFVHFLRMFVLF